MATRLAALLTLALAVVDSACSSSPPNRGAPVNGGAPTGASGQAGASGSGASGASGAGAAGASGSGGASSRAVAVCQRWTADRADLSEGTWTGSVAACDPGEITAPARQNALRLLNLYRFLTDMPEVTEDATLDTQAQACALIQSANPLSHAPVDTSVCYTKLGADASGRSSISSGPVVRSIDAYMTDGGSNAGTMGHRRWVLANSLGPVGFGSAKGSCFYQVGGTGKAGAAYAVWPPEGEVPFAALATTKVDSAGWTVQSDSITLSDSAVVSVSDAGQDLPVASSVLPGGYGSQYALRFVPNGWTTQAGHDYTVTVSGASAPLSYTVRVVDCAAIN